VDDAAVLAHPERQRVDLEVAVRRVVRRSQLAAELERLRNLYR